MCQDLLNKKNRSQKGFTLLEIAMSMVIFGIIVVMLSLPMYTGLSLLVGDSNIVRANNLAKAYIKDLDNKWKIQSTFDDAELVELDAFYTDNNKYVVNVGVENIHTDENSVVIIRRVKVIYKNQDGELLTDIFYDFKRPQA